MTDIIRSYIRGGWNRYGIDDETAVDTMKWMASVSVLLMFYSSDDPRMFFCDDIIDGIEIRDGYRHNAIQRMQTYRNMKMALTQEAIDALYSAAMNNLNAIHDLYAINAGILKNIRGHAFMHEDRREMKAYVTYIYVHLIASLINFGNEFSDGDDNRNKYGQYLLSMMFAVPNSISSTFETRHYDITAHYDGSVRGFPTWIDPEDIVTPDMMIDMMSFESFEKTMRADGRGGIPPYCNDDRGLPGFTTAYEAVLIPQIPSIMNAMITEHMTYGEAFDRATSYITAIIARNHAGPMQRLVIPALSMHSLEILSTTADFSRIQRHMPIQYDMFQRWDAISRRHMSDNDWVVEHLDIIDGNDDIAYDVLINEIRHVSHRPSSQRQCGIDYLDGMEGGIGPLIHEIFSAAVSTQDVDLLGAANLLAAIDGTVCASGDNRTVYLTREQIREVFSGLHRELPLDFVVENMLSWSDDNNPENHRERDIDGNAVTLGSVALCLVK